MFWRFLAAKSDGHCIHPLTCHLLDTACVVRALLEQPTNRSLLVRMAGWMQLDEAGATCWLSYLAGTHDIGKATPPFQRLIGQCDEPQLRQAGLDFPVGKLHHGTLSAAILKSALVEGEVSSPIAAPAAYRLALAVAGHHGAFASPEAIEQAEYAMGGGGWKQARTEVLAELARASGLTACQSAPASTLAPNNAFLVILAGLTSVADWIASNTLFFPYAAPEIDLEEYVEQSRRQAQGALTRLGWDSWRPPATALDFVNTFGFEPRPLQRLVSSLCDNTVGPAMLLIEAPMGEGKTEAALTAADHDVAAVGQRGIYFALPSQATSNAMLTRMVEFLEARFLGQHPELHLLHGHAALSDDYREMQLAAIDSDGDCGNGVAAHEWFLNRKRGLLSPFAVGTIDQALMATLQTKHMFVRLFGLAGKTIVFDEIHAYDAYMSVLFERLLRWLAAMGSSVVLLSATLPASRRRALLDAYSTAVIEDTTYPRMTISDGTAARAIHVPVAEDRQTLLQLRRIDPDPDALTWLLRQQLADGGCAAVICNTVGRAQEVYRVLKAGLASGPFAIDIDLLHARYPFIERQAREQRAIQRYGGSGWKNGERPKRAVLVSTQIIEQSLNVDFDVMVSDLGPIDLVLQRAGRIHRYRSLAGEPISRPNELKDPTIWLATSAPSATEAPRFGNDEYVYERYILLMTFAKLLLDNVQSIAIPEDLQDLVDAVYADDIPSNVSPVWREALVKAQSEAKRDREKAEAVARTALIIAPDSRGSITTAQNLQLEEDSPDAHHTLQALTRYGRPSTQVVCVNEAGGRCYLDREGQAGIDPDVVPSYPDARHTWVRQLIMNSVSISHPGLAAGLRSQRPAAWEGVGLLRHHRLLRFTDGQAQVGPYRVIWHAEEGIIITREGSTSQED